MWCMLIPISSIMCGPPSVHTVCSKSGWLSFTVLQSSVVERVREGGREMMRNGGNRKMSRRVNTETGVWQGTMIRFINHPMLFSLLRDCCETLSANWSSQCPTTETHLSIFLFGLPILSCIPSHSSHTSPQRLSFPFLLSLGCDYIFSNQDWLALKASFLLLSPSLCFLLLSQGCVILPSLSPQTIG